MARLASVILFTLVVLEAMLSGPALTVLAQSQGLDKLLEVVGNDLVLTYEVVRSVYISNLSGRLVVYKVGQEYMVRVRTKGASSVVVEAYRFPGSTVEVSVLSSDWVGVGGFMYWVVSNYTNFLLKHILIDYNQTVSRDLAIDVINSLMAVPLIREGVARSCLNIPVYDAYISGFEASVTTDAGSGVAYYDCMYGILIKANMSKLTQQVVDNTVYTMKDSIYLEIRRANTEILNRIVFKEQPPGSYDLWVLAVPVAAACFASALMLYYIIRLRGRTR
ncbi:MAG: hypothetical protein QW705_05585 [Zestosphaera sp.]